MSVASAPSETLPCGQCEFRRITYVCGASPTSDCSIAACHDPFGLSVKRVKLLRSMNHARAAVLAVGADVTGLQAIDNLLDALRELQSLLDANAKLAQPDDLLVEECAPDTPSALQSA